MRHARHVPTAAEDVAAIRARHDARAAVSILTGRRALALEAAATFRNANKPDLTRIQMSTAMTYYDAMLDARRDAESWEARNK